MSLTEFKLSSAEPPKAFKRLIRGAPYRAPRAPIKKAGPARHAVARAPGRRGPNSTILNTAQGYCAVRRPARRRRAALGGPAPLDDGGWGAACAFGVPTFVEEPPRRRKAPAAPARSSRRRSMKLYNDLRTAVPRSDASTRRRRFYTTQAPRPAAAEPPGLRPDSMALAAAYGRPPKPRRKQPAPSTGIGALSGPGAAAVATRAACEKEAAAKKAWRARAGHRPTEGGLGRSLFD